MRAPLLDGYFHLPGTQINQIPIGRLESEAERLVTWLRYGKTAAAASASSTTNNSGGAVGASGCSKLGRLLGGPNTTSGGGGGGGGTSFLSTWVSMNLDFQEVSSQPPSLLKSVFLAASMIVFTFLAACLPPFLHSQLIPQVQKKVIELYQHQSRLKELWDSGHSCLDKFRRLRMFEEDANHLGEWLAQVRHLLLTKGSDIGRNASQVSAHARVCVVLLR